MEKKNVFEDFKSSFEKQNRLIKLSLLVVVVLLMACLFLVNANKTMFLRVNSEYLTSELPMKEICHFSIKTITEMKLSSSFISKNIQEYFKASKNPAIKADKIFVPIIISEDKCKVIVSEQDKLRAFVLTLEKKESNPFLYKTIDINEVVVDEKEAI